MAKSLTEFIKKDNEFVWGKRAHSHWLDLVKQVLTQAPVLKFFDPQKENLLQCDASLSGLGACYRALTPTETDYAPVGKKLLVIVFGVEGFEGYVYGRKVFIDTGHKPLESMKKNERVHQSDCRKCRCLTRFVQFKGTEMRVVDLLNQAYLPLAG